MNYRAVLGLQNVQVRPLKTEGVAMDVNISTTQLDHLLPSEIVSKRFNLCLGILLCKLEKMTVLSSREWRHVLGTYWQL